MAQITTWKITAWVSASLIYFSGMFRKQRWWDVNKTQILYKSYTVDLIQSDELKKKQIFSGLTKVQNTKTQYFAISK